MDEEQSRGHAHSATPSRSGSSDSGEEEFGTPATRNAERHQDAGPLLPHQLIPAHIKDKEKIDVSESDAATAVNHMFCHNTFIMQQEYGLLPYCVVCSPVWASGARMAEHSRSRVALTTMHLGGCINSEEVPLTITSRHLLRAAQG